MVFEKPAFMSGASRQTSSSLRGTFPQTLTLLGGAMFIAWRMSHPVLGQCRRGPSHFWHCRAYLDTPKNGLVLHPSSRKDVRQIPTPGHPSVDRVGRYTDLVGCVLVPVAVSRGSLTWIPGSQHLCQAHQDKQPWTSGKPLWRDLVYYLSPKTPSSWGMLTRPESFLSSSGVSGLRLCTWIHLKQDFVPHCPFGGTFDKYRVDRHHLSNTTYNLLRLIIYHQENYFIFFFNGIRVITV